MSEEEAVINISVALGIPPDYVRMMAGRIKGLAHEADAQKLSALIQARRTFIKPKKHKMRVQIEIPDRLLNRARGIFILEGKDDCEQAITSAIEHDGPIDITHELEGEDTHEYEKLLVGLAAVAVMKLHADGEVRG